MTPFLADVVLSNGLAYFARITDADMERFVMGGGATTGVAFLIRRGDESVWAWAPFRRDAIVAIVPRSALTPNGEALLREPVPERPGWAPD